MRIQHGGPSAASFFSGVADLDGIVGGIRPGDNVVFHAAEAGLYPLFTRALAAWCLGKKRRLVYVRVDGSLDEVFKGLPQEDVFELDAHGQGVQPPGAAFNAYVELQGPRVCYVWDNFSALQPSLGGEAGLRAFFLAACPLLSELEAVTYWLLLKEQHSSETEAAVQRAAQVFLELATEGDKTFLCALKTQGRYSEQMLLPCEVVVDSKREGIRLTPLFGEDGPQVALLRKKGAKLALGMSHAADAQAELVQKSRVLSTLLKTLQSASAFLARTLDEQQALEETLRLCDEVLGLKTSWIVRTEDGEHFYPVATRGLPPALEAEGQLALRWGPCRCQRRLLRGELGQAVNIVRCERLERARGDLQGLAYHACVPIQHREQVWGLLNLAYTAERQLSVEELKVLTALGIQLCAALERTQTHRQAYQQTAELTARQRVTESVLRVMDLEERLHIALEEILNLVMHQRAPATGNGAAPPNAVRGAIYLVEGERLVLRIQRGFSEGFLALARDVLLEVCPWVSTPITVQAPWEKNDPITEALSQESVMAWTSLPLNVEGRLEGVLLLADRQTAALDRDTLRAMGALADQVAVALHNARLYARSQERLARLVTLREIDKAIAAQLSLEEVVSVVLERVHPHVHADAVGLSLVDSDKKRTTLTLLRLQRAGQKVQNEAFELSDSLLEWLVVRQQAVMIYDLLSDPRVQGYRQVVRRYGLKSYLGVPLVVQDETIGILHIFTLEPHAFDAEEESFFVTMAGQAAISIQNARMYEAALRRGQALATLADSALSVVKQGLEVANESIRALFQGTCRGTGANWGVWLNYDEAQRQLRPGVLIGFAPEDQAAVERALSVRLNDPWAPAVAALEGHALHLKQPQSSPLWPDFHLAVKCVYCTPLIHVKRLYGVFVLLSDQKDAFGAEDRSLADTFAAYAAAGLDNTRLYK